MSPSIIRKDPNGGVEKVNTRRYSKEEELILARLIRQNASNLGLFDDQIKSIGKKMIKYKKGYANLFEEFLRQSPKTAGSRTDKSIKDKIKNMLDLIACLHHDMRTRAIGHHSNETITALSEISRMNIHVSPPTSTKKSSSVNPKKKRIGKQTVLRRTITGIQQQKKNVFPVSLMDDNDSNDDNDDSSNDIFSETEESSISMQESNSEDKSNSGTPPSSTISSRPPKRVLPQRAASKPRPTRNAATAATATTTTATAATAGSRTSSSTTTTTIPKRNDSLPEIPNNPPISSSSPSNVLRQPSSLPEMNPGTDKGADISRNVSTVPVPVPVPAPAPVMIPPAAQSTNHQSMYISANSMFLPPEIRQDGQSSRNMGRQRSGNEKAVMGMMEIENGQQPGTMSSSLPSNTSRPMSGVPVAYPGQVGQRDGTMTVNWNPVPSNNMHLSVGQGAPFIIRNCTVTIDSIYNYGQDYHGVGRQQIMNELDSLIGELRQLS